MSKFFNDIEEEKKEIRKKFSNSKQVEKLSKKEKLQHELESKITELRKNKKNVKKFLNDLKKWDGLDSSELKEFLYSKDVYVKNNKKIIDDHFSKVKIEEQLEEQVENIIIDEEKEYEKIIKNANTEEVLKNLNDLYEKTNDEVLKRNITINLLSIYTKNKDIENMYKYFLCLADKSFVGINIDFYLDEFKNNNIELYKNVLKKLKNKDIETAERRLLDIEDWVYTKYIDFIIVKNVELDNIDEVVSRFNELDFKNYCDNLFKQNIKKIANYLFEKKEYLKAFKCFNFLYYNGEIDKLKMYFFCVILNKKIKQEKIFREFLDDFKSFGENTFLLESHDKIFELYRSFYLLHMYDVENCFKILNKIDSRFNDISVLNGINV